MSDILLIFPKPTATSPQQIPAISIFYPGESAAKEGFSVEYWDERYDSLEDLHQKAQRARMVGISSLSGYMLGRTVEILKWCRFKFPEKKIILGGVHATFLPENSLREPFVDFTVLGEGEKRLPALLRAIFSGGGFEEIDGLGYKKDGRIIVNPRTEVLNLEESSVTLLSERTRRYFEIAAKKNWVIYPSTRGCPWASRKRACTFCSVRDQYLGLYRVVPFEIWSRDLEEIFSLHPFSLIELEDENSSWFTRHPEYAVFLQEKGIKYHLHLRADQLQEERVIRRLAETGCLRIHIGVESGSDRVRNEIYQKGEDVRCFYRAATLLAKYGIEGVYTYVIGAPTETREEIFQTLKLSDELSGLHPQGKSRSAVYILIALPGTDIFKLAEKEGWKIPQTMEEWTKVSAANNPCLPQEVNNIYFIAGFHHNRHHKTAQNFPGLWRGVILPFEILCELRWAARFFKYFGLEKFLIERLLSWRTKSSLAVD